MCRDTPEHQRLQEADAGTKPWRKWGPYVSDRAWGTVREDYSTDGNAWRYFPHEHARSRAYRWNEDGLFGICDDRQTLCLALALWNEKDRMLKERLFGLTGPEGNHGEDVKELYYYLDATPTASYLKALYKYPQGAFPYEELVMVNHHRTRTEPEYELLDTGLFDENRYFDVFLEVAKADAEDLLLLITCINRGPDPAPLHVLPTLWFRNTWSWDLAATKPILRRRENGLQAELASGEIYTLETDGEPETLFTENDSNVQVLFGGNNPTPFVKDAFHAVVVDGQRNAVNPYEVGTKAALHFAFTLQPGETRTLRLRLSPGAGLFGIDDAFDTQFAARRAEADAFYEATLAPSLSPDERLVSRMALGGMVWSQQWYHFDVDRWQKGDFPAQPAPPETRLKGRNAHWQHLRLADVISMPDKWEYPWFAAWDLAFHTLPLAQIDLGLAKHQLMLLLSERALHPNGQIPAYEWVFDDVNPPVHSIAALDLFRREVEQTGHRDVDFLRRVFHKLLVNFTWWVNQKDADGNNAFEGGFLGLDNIGVFDRSAPLPAGVRLEQADGTAWMGIFALSMLSIALEISRDDAAYQDIALKFLDHFLSLMGVMEDRVGQVDLWDAEEGFFFDLLRMPDGSATPIRLRTMVGLLPLVAAWSVPPGVLESLPRFQAVVDRHASLGRTLGWLQRPGAGGRRLLALVDPERAGQLFQRMFDESRFLSSFGVRSLSRAYETEPYVFEIGRTVHSVFYEPAESSSGLFGGNSNWRGPIWFPVNYLLIRALRRYHEYLGDGWKIQVPTGSGREMHLGEAADELSRRLASIFLKDREGVRPVWGDAAKLQFDREFRDMPLFYEYFHGNTGAGLGASHQTGWTGLLATIIDELHGRAR